MSEEPQSGEKCTGREIAMTRHPNGSAGVESTASRISPNEAAEIDTAQQTFFSEEALLKYCFRAYPCHLILVRTAYLAKS
jgi:hypothetical protein